MSKILEVAKAFEQQSKKELQNTNEIVQNAIKQHERDLIASFQSANKNLESVIQTEQAKLTKKLRRVFSITSLIVLLVFAGLIAVIIVWGKMEYNKMSQWQQSANNYEKISQSIKVSQCKVNDTISQYCIAIDPKYKGQFWGENGNLAILPIAVEN